MEEAWPVGVYSKLVPAGSSSPNPKLAPRILQYFDFSILVSSCFIILLVYEFTLISSRRV